GLPGLPPEDRREARPGGADVRPGRAGGRGEGPGSGRGEEPVGRVRRRELAPGLDGRLSRGSPPELRIGGRATGGLGRRSSFFQTKERERTADSADDADLAFMRLRTFFMRACELE